MNYNNIKQKVPEPQIIPWQQAHCTLCRKRAESTLDMRINFKECQSCCRIFCNRCMVSDNGYHKATEAFRSDQICPDCSKSHILESHLILQSRYKTFRKALIESHLKNEPVILAYIDMFMK